MEEATVLEKVLGRDRTKKLQDRLGVERGRRDRLAERIASAEAKVASLSAEAQRLAFEGHDDATLDAAESKKRAAEDRVITLRGALPACDKEIQDLEAQLAEIADMALRQRTADTIDAWASDLAAAEKNFDRVAAQIAEIAEAAGAVHLDCQAVAHFAAGARVELKPAIEAISTFLRTYARGVRAGDRVAALPKPAPVISVKTYTAPPMRKVFATKPIKWMGGEHNELQTSPMGHDVDLPIPLADRAIALGAAVAPDHEIATRMRGGYAMISPDLGKCIALDDDAEAAPPPPSERAAAPPVIRPFNSKTRAELPPGFELLPVGQPYAGKISAARTIPGGADDE
jgi:hypothetical protein